MNDILSNLDDKSLVDIQGLLVISGTVESVFDRVLLKSAYISIFFISLQFTRKNPGSIKSEKEKCSKMRKWQYLEICPFDLGRPCILILVFLTNSNGNEANVAYFS